VAGAALEVFRRFADHDWIVNSRNSGDEEVIRTVASLAGFQPRITHRVDSLELVQDMILAGLGVGLLPAWRPVRRGVVLRPLGQPDVTQRPFAVNRRGRSAWPPLALVLQLLGEISGLTARRTNDELRVSPGRRRARGWCAVVVKPPPVRLAGRQAARSAPAAESGQREKRRLAQLERVERQGVRRLPGNCLCRRRGGRLPRTMPRTAAGRRCPR
jgi:hypothetical protein